MFVFLYSVILIMEYRGISDTVNDLFSHLRLGKRTFNLASSPENAIRELKNHFIQGSTSCLHYTLIWCFMLMSHSRQYGIMTIENSLVHTLHSRCKFTQTGRWNNSSINTVNKEKKIQNLIFYLFEKLSSYAKLYRVRDQVRVINKAQWHVFF